MSIIAYASAPAGANLAGEDTIDLSAWAAVRATAVSRLTDSPAVDAAWLVYHMLGQFGVEELAELLGVNDDEVLHLYVDHVFRKTREYHLVGMRTSRLYLPGEVAREWLATSVDDLAADYEVRPSTAASMQDLARNILADLDAAEWSCQHGTGPGRCEVCPADEQSPATGGDR
jgi:hypothetical protein